MKTINYFLKGNGRLLIIPFLLLALTVGCTKQDAIPEVIDDPNLKSKVIVNSPVTLQGFMRWSVYAKAEHKVIVNPAEMYTMCTAELSFTDDQNFVLNTTESLDFGDGPFIFRQISFKGKMTPGGALKFTWPETWIEMNWGTMELENTPYANVVAQIRAHTGYELTGPGVNKNTVNYKGFFDGNTFFADCNANAFQLQEGEMGAPYNILVSGPIIFSMSTELQVVD